MDNKTVKNSLRQIREDRNMTQEQLAEVSGVARYIISEFENGKRRPTPRTINKLAEALGCSYIELLKNNKNEDTPEKENLGEKRQRYLLEAISLTREHYGQNGFDEEMMMKISGYLSHIIEEYQTSSDQEKIAITTKVKEQEAKLLANKLFLQTKDTTHES